MYYSYTCTYCGRLFYTYDRDKHHAANRLYHTIKQHLTDYDEDHREYELDDGEHADTEQIYHEMHVSSHAPPGGYEATGHKFKQHEETGSHASPKNKHSHKASFIGIIVLFVILLSFFALYFLVPSFQNYINTFVIPKPFS